MFDRHLSSLSGKHKRKWIYNFFTQSYQFLWISIKRPIFGKAFREIKVIGDSYDYYLQYRLYRNNQSLWRVHHNRSFRYTSRLFNSFEYRLVSYIRFEFILYHFNDIYIYLFHVNFESLHEIQIQNKFKMKLKLIWK